VVPVEVVPVDVLVLVLVPIGAAAAVGPEPGGQTMRRGPTGTWLAPVVLVTGADVIPVPIVAVLVVAS
jgi:hypothetical protein